ncbi:hypothetical protein [Streptomyces clavuligerus]|nr:hypothetical protein [Streptomyces clavuligerus]
MVLALGNVLTALAHGFGLLVVSRIVLGIAMGRGVGAGRRRGATARRAP